MSKHHKDQKHQKKQNAHLLRIQQVLHQRAPLAPQGVSRIVLYRCPLCGYPWLMQGDQPRLRMDDATLAFWVARLQANLQQLPPAVCRLCGFAQGTGILQVDEYGQGKAYGLTWEAETPQGAHLFAFITGMRWLERVQTAGTLARALSPVVLAPRTYAAVLRWLADELGTRSTFACVHVLTAQDSQAFTRDIPPGHGASGTENWQWKGGAFLLDCPPLQDEAMVMLGIAQPASEPGNLPLLLDTWHELAELIAPALPRDLPDDETGIQETRL